jgi:hypothetical protein
MTHDAVSRSVLRSYLAQPSIAAASSKSFPVIPPLSCVLSVNVTAV